MYVFPLSQLFRTIANLSGCSAAPNRPDGQAFPLHAFLSLSYRLIPTSSAPSDIPFVHSVVCEIFLQATFTIKITKGARKFGEIF